MRGRMLVFDLVGGDRRVWQRITQLRYSIRGAGLVFVRHSASGPGARNPPGAPGKEDA
jgi:hypothetical protein